MKINRLIYEDLLKEQGIKLDSNDIISEDLNSKLKEGMTIEVVDVVVETIKESKSIDYGVEFVEDANLVKGTTKVYNEGISGVNDIVYTLTYHNGELIEKKFIEELVKVEPQNKVVQKGIKNEVKVLSSRGTNSRTDVISLSSTINTLWN